jgi:hypothetical protein
MAYSYYNYTGNGSQTQFPVAFDYIRREHVLATVAGSPATFTWVNNSLIQMDTAPANGAAVRVYRVTPLSAPLVDFADGATLVAADLDTNAKQSIYTQQELDDSLVEGLAGVIPNGDKGDITTSVGGTVWTIDSGAVVEAKIGTGAVVEAKLGTGAVTSAKIADGTIVNADINASAAIAATKLAFASAGNIAATTVQAALQELDDEKAPIASPTFTGTPAAPTATAGTNTTQLATTAFVITARDSSLPLAGGTMTGNIAFASDQPQVCKAWVNFNGTGTVAIRASYNVSSITDNAVGWYTVNFTTALADANYAAFVNVFPETSGTSAQGSGSLRGTRTKTTTAIGFGTVNYTDAALTDFQEIDVAIFR